jgi:fatty-acyl-CoA synthase
MESMAIESLDWLRKDVVRRWAEGAPQRMAVAEMFSGLRLTYAQLDAQIDTCAEWLLAQPGVKKGDRIVLLARNGVHYPVLFYACARAGVIFQPINWRLMGPEMRMLVEDAEPTLLLTTDEFMPLAGVAASGFAGCRVQSIGAHGETLQQALAAHGPAKQLYEIEDPDGVWTLLYTSGTTGRPKGVIVTPRTGWFSANNFVWINQLTRKCAMLCEVPLFHTGGLFALLHASMFAGMRVWMTDRFNPEDTLRYIDDPEMGVTHMFVVPQIVQILRDHPNYRKTDLSRIQAWCSGGAPLAPALQMAMLQDGVLLTNGFGSTETGSTTGMPLDPEILLAKPGTCGVTGPATDIKLMDADGNPVAQGEVGELWIRGPNVMPGYWNRPEANEAAFQDGWYKTGDAGYLDEDNYLYLVDRWKDMFISGGENVYPAEVESALLEHPLIADVAVIGVSDPKWTEVGAAYVVKREGLTEDAIRAHAKERLAGYKRPTHIVFVESIERTPSGKIKKQELRKDWAARQSARPPVPAK